MRANTTIITKTALRCLGRMTPMERAAGRFLRSDDGHPSAPAADAPASDAPAAEAPAPDPVAAPAAEAGDDTILGAPKTDALADPAPADGEPAADPVDDAPAADAPYEGLTPPEGFAALDADALTAATPLMRGLGLDAEKAQTFLNDAAPIITGLIDKARDADAAQTKAQQEALRAEWAETIKADAEFGGAKFSKTVSDAGVFMDRFLDQEGRDLLNASGLGNHPSLVRAFAKAGMHFAEGEIITGEPAPVAKGHPLYDDVFLPPEKRRG